MNDDKIISLPFILKSTYCGLHQKEDNNIQNEVAGNFNVADINHIVLI